MIFWQEQAIVLYTKPFGEKDSILHVLSYQHGKCSGLVRNGNAMKQKLLLQPGNILDVKWYARLESQLGRFVVEPENLAGCRLLVNNNSLVALASVCSLLQVCLAERDPNKKLFELTKKYLLELENANDLFNHGKWELDLLKSIGYDIDIESALLASDNDYPAYVSPPSCRVIGYGAASDWRKRLWNLPIAIVENRNPVNYQELDDVLLLTENVLLRHVLSKTQATLPFGASYIRRCIKEKI